MARQKMRKQSIEQTLLQLLIPVGGLLVAVLILGSGISAIYVISAFIMALFAITVALAFWFRLHKSSGRPFVSEQAVLRPKQRGYSSIGSPQPSPALEAAIAEAMRTREVIEPRSTPATFSEESLRKMDWLAFEHLVVEIFRYLGFTTRKTNPGADGGVDIELYDPNASPEADPKVLIQCKARGTSSIGVDKARELYGVMAARKVSRGLLICNTWFTPDALEFGRANPTLQMADLPWIMKQLGKVSEIERRRWEKRFLGVDYDVPSCPQCEIKLVVRTGKQGAFWGCPNFPRGCRSKLPMRSDRNGALADSRREPPENVGDSKGGAFMEGGPTTIGLARPMGPNT
ncbi:MAG TPA: restriction endonuclease [Fibrobacteria bacterium]|nr:restriction endonuclease [Fibrobacteria bacterium]